MTAPSEKIGIISDHLTEGNHCLKQFVMSNWLPSRFCQVRWSPSSTCSKVCRSWRWTSVTSTLTPWRLSSSISLFSIHSDVQLGYTLLPSILPTYSYLSGSFHPFHNPLPLVFHICYRNCSLQLCKQSLVFEEDFSVTMAANLLSEYADFASTLPIDHFNNWWSQ